MPPSAPNDSLLLEEDGPAAPSEPASELPPWRILIADDDVDVHVVTKFALSNSSFQGRRLSFLHAYDGNEAIEVMKATPDIALVLLDVIMETSDAGLKVARRLREELGNELVRIVLRTGQPGQALEHSIIVDYDINDFWCKADLTNRKLFTTVISSLRAYSAIKAAAEAQEMLRQELAEARNVQAAVNQHALVVSFNRSGIILDANDRLCKFLQIERSRLVGRDLQSLHTSPFPQPLAGDILNALVREGGWAGDIHTTSPAGAPMSLRVAILAFKDAGGRAYQYVAVATEL